MKLDKRDLKILEILHKDPRISYAQLGKQLKISTNTAKYRLDNLFKREIVLNTIPIINYPIIGYYTALVFIKVKERKGNLFKEFVQKQNNIITTEILFGTYDYYVELAFSSIIQLTKSIEELTLFFGENLESCKTHITVKRIKAQQRFPKLHQEKDEAKKLYFFPEGKLPETSGNIIALDSNETKVLSLLSKNARQSYQDIAKATHQSLQNVKNIVDRLQKKEVIAYFIPIYNGQKLGYMQYAMQVYFYKFTSEKLKRMYNSIKNNESITVAVQLADIPGVFLIVKTASTQEFEQFVKQFYEENSDIIQKLDFMHSQGLIKFERYPNVFLNNL